MTELLTVNNLVTQFKTESGVVKAVDGMTYHVNEQEIVGLVGESGCGKSVSQLSTLQLISSPGEIAQGEIIFEGTDLLKHDKNGPQMRAVRGAKIAMIFQESLELHLKMNKDAARERAIELLATVGIPGGQNRIDDYPHHFSGGMRQRVMIAMGLSCNPKILIADEPTTALDVTTQAQLLELMKEMVEKFQASLVIVTHNLGVVARYAQRIYVMYAGRIVETSTTKEIFGNPQHPYTIGLLKSIPRLDEEEGRKLIPINGLPPNLINMPPTCAFLPRCTYKLEKCAREPWPPLSPVSEGHYVSCYANTKEKTSESESK